VSRIDEIEKFINHFSSFTKEQFVNLFHKDAQWQNLPYRSDPIAYGLDEIWGRIKESNNAFTEIEHTTEDYVESGNKVWIYFSLSYLHSGSFLGIPATNNRISITGVSTYEFKEDKVWRVRVLNDSLSIFMQLGKVVFEENNQEKIEKYLDVLRGMGLAPKMLKD